MIGSEHRQFAAPDPGHDRAGDRLRFAGGNHILSVLQSPGVMMSSGMAPPQAAMSGAAAVQNTSGGSAPVQHVQIAVAGLLVLSLAALVAMHKAGFNFNVTVG